MPPTAAKYYFERHIIFEISLREISKMMCLSKDNLARSALKNLFTQPPEKKHSAARGGKRLFMALRAKLYLDGAIFFLILRSKIKKKMAPSKECFAAEGGEILFTQPLHQ
jgi:hypothetical protein